MHQTKKMIKQTIKKIKIIYYPWHSFRLFINKKKEELKKKAYKRYGYDALRIICQIVLENNFKIAVTEGTLLGLYRDKKLIPWDDDLDFMIIADSYFSWERLEEKLKSNNFWKYREKRKNGNLISQAYKWKNVHCDFVLMDSGKEHIKVDYGCYEYKNLTYVNNVESEYQVWEIEIPAVKKIIYKKINDIKIPFPENSEDILVALYGDWKNPNSNYKPQRKEIRKKFVFTYFTKNKKIR